ncbi:MAG: hypothetical protein DRJ55_03305 [Thermoprotei archaeon]|nr:MAG: hypothetical protein DRJ55_03305 [Thermoprotei archaeon]
MEYFLENISEVMSKDFLVLKPADTAEKALGLMRESGVSVILVISKKKDLRLVSSLHLLEAGDFPNTKLGSIARPAPRFTPNDAILDAAKALVSHRIEAVPILDRNENILGIVTRNDIVKYALKTRWLDTFKVKDAMSTNLVIASPLDSASKVRRLIVNHGIKQVLIIGEDGKLVGIVKIRDLLERIYGITVRRSTVGERVGETNRPLSHRAKGIMSRPVITVNTEGNLSEAAEIMLTKEHCIPVLEEGYVVGVITRSDIIKMIAALDMMPTLPVTFKGIEKIPEHLFDRASAGISRTLERFARTTDLFEGRVVVKQKNREGSRALYIFEVSAKIAKNMFSASKSSWEPLKAFIKALRSLERQSEKAKTKKRKAERRRKRTSSA